MLIVYFVDITSMQLCDNRVLQYFYNCLIFFYETITEFHFDFHYVKVSKY